MPAKDDISLKPGLATPQFRLWAVLTLALLIGTVIFIPWRIGSLGYMPSDDAGRHIGKAISGKAWNEILVMRPEITTDMHHGWDAMLTFLHTRAGLGADALIAFSVYGKITYKFQQDITDFPL